VKKLKSKPANKLSRSQNYTANSSNRPKYTKTTGQR